MLTRIEINEILQKKKNSEMMEAAEQESRLQFHTDNISRKAGTLGGYANKFLSSVRQVLPKDKFNVFRSLFRYPLISCRLTDEIYSHLHKIKDGIDPVRDIRFRDDVYLADCEEFLEESGINNRLDIDLWQRMKSQINSVVVVDMPTEQIENRPSPYYYHVDITAILFIKEINGNIEYIIYESGDKQITVIDDKSYQVYSYDSGELGELISEAFHDLGYCPARMFWADRIGVGSIVAKHPLSLYLESLDWYLMYSVMKRNLDLYAPYPVYYGFQTDCDYEDAHERYCDGGFLVNKERHHLLDGEGGLVGCPKCNSRITGVGTFVEVPAPMNGEAPLSPPVGKLDIDRGAVEHNSSEVERLAREIFKGVTGNEYGVSNTEAMNEVQVMSLFESSEQVLLSLQRNFEIIESWILKTVLRLRYRDAFEEVFISYGTSHYILTPSIILEAYQSAVKNELPDFILDLIMKKYLQSKYKNNPKGYNRAYILSQLEPFKHLKKTQVAEMYKAGVIPFEDYVLKMNFSSLLNRFEREITTLEAYSMDKDFASVIDEITGILKGYIINPNALRIEEVEEVEEEVENNSN